jgi:serine phosphatase RsbU (regulator of sigma subunit)
MPSLHAESGPLQGQVFPLDRERTILGRSEESDVVIPSTKVSRSHAQILRVNAGFYIEDLRSRNKTFVNDCLVEQRQLLQHGDRIRLSDFQASFFEHEPDAGDGSTFLHAALPSSTGLRLETQPTERLAALLGITAKLSKTLQLDVLLPEIAAALLELFHQADRCLLILEEADTGALVPEVIKTRQPAPESALIFSHSILRQCLQSNKALLLEDSGTRVPMTASVSAAQIRSVMCVPLTTAEGKPFGVIQIDTQDYTKTFTEDDLRLLCGVGQQASLALENARFHEERLAQDRVRRDLDFARQVQRNLLPHDTPEVAGYEFFAHYAAAQAIGGDYYDFVPLPGQRLAITVGDVAGKGIPAALLMARFSSEARTCLLTKRQPAAAIARLNEVLYPQTSAVDKFVTLVLAVLNPATHVVTLVSAGNPVPLLFRRARGKLRSAMPLEAVGFPVGLSEHATYACTQLKLAPGDVLMLFSDGIADARNPAGKPFGSAGFRRAVKDQPRGTPRSLGERVISLVKRHAAGHVPFDDITLLCVGRRG